MYMNPWQLIFLQSKVNDNPYYGDDLATQNWAWPQETWFQRRLREQRKKPWLSDGLLDAQPARFSRPPSRITSDAATRSELCQ
jgi:hypothetical protein